MMRSQVVAIAFLGLAVSGCVESQSAYVPVDPRSKLKCRIRPLLKLASTLWKVQVLTAHEWFGTKLRQ